jgi:hypothetical protein
MSIQGDNVVAARARCFCCASPNFGAARDFQVAGVDYWILISQSRLTFISDLAHRRPASAHFLTRRCERIPFLLERTLYFQAAMAEGVI